MDWAEMFKQMRRFLPRVEILNPDEGGLFLRGGKLKKQVGAGCYFCLPYFDQIARYTNVPTIDEVKQQSITTKDKKDIFISWTVSVMPHDAAKAFLWVDDVGEQVASAVAGRIVEYIGKHDYEKIKPHLLTNSVMQSEFLEHIREQFGIDVQFFYVHDLGLHKIFRLVQHDTYED